MTTVQYTVTGMTCAHCATSVREEIEEIPGVTNVQVDLESGAVAVESDTEIKTEQVRAAVEEAGYALR